jgi:hypothetical protein
MPERTGRPYPNRITPRGTAPCLHVCERLRRFSSDASAADQFIKPQSLGALQAGLACAACAALAAHADEGTEHMVAHRGNAACACSRLRHGWQKQAGGRMLRKPRRWTSVNRSWKRERSGQKKNLCFSGSRHFLWARSGPNHKNSNDKTSYIEDGCALHAADWLWRRWRQQSQER